MKRIIFFFQLLLITISTLSAQEFDTITDIRDGQKYGIVKIGDQWWMAENLNYYKSSGSWYYDNDSLIYSDSLGRLYDWQTALDVCPYGWNLPSDQEWLKLEEHLGMDNIELIKLGEWRGTDEGGELKDTGSNVWNSPNIGATNSTGFSGRPSGYRHPNGSFIGYGLNALYWSSTETDNIGATARRLDYDKSSIYRDNYFDKESAYAVRCITDTLITPLDISLSGTNTSNLGGIDGSIEATISGGYKPYSISWSTGDTTENLDGLSAGVFSVLVTDALDGTISDSIRIYDTFIDNRDGQRYKVIQLGDQLWMAENLKATEYSDHTAIPIIESSSVWDNLGYSDKAWCYYNNSIENGNTFGALYTWAAAMNSAAGSNNNPSGVQGVCPTGWHLPSDSEWKLLETYLGMNQSEANAIGWRGTNEGGKLKETDTTHWRSPNTGATNESGFTALPGGGRDDSGSFDPIREHGPMWTATENSSTYSWVRGLTYDRSKIYRHYRGKTMGLSVRCLRSISYIDSLQINKVDVSCHGYTDGSIELKVFGQGPFSYLWSNGDTTSNLSYIPAGKYWVTVSDSDGGILLDTIFVVEPPPLQVEFITTISCYGDSTGSISITVTGGTPPYQYLWNNNASTDSLFGVASGIYNVTITDNNSCDNVAVDSVGEYPEIITGQITGQINVTPAEVYIYSVNEKLTSVFNWSISGGNIVSGQGTNSINVQWGSVGSGMVSVVETDINGCIGDTVSLDVLIGSTGVENNFENELHIYPNPSSDVTLIEFPNPEGSEYQFIVTDMTGKVVKLIINITEDKIEIDRDGLSDGIYLIELRGPRIYRGMVVIK